MIALSVFGVIVGLLFPAALFIMERNAAVFGDGGGKETGPPMSGVRPVPGVKPVRGVSPVRKLLGSNGRGAPGACPFASRGPASIAGESGPDRSELAKDDDENQLYVGSAGDEIDASGGNIGFGDASRSFLTRAGDRGRSLFESVLLLPWVEGPRASCTGEWATVRTLEAECLEEAEKDCSKGLGSRSKLLRNGRGGGRRVDAAPLACFELGLPFKTVGGVGPVMVTTESASSSRLSVDCSGES